MDMEDRDETILFLRERGVTLREIGARVNLSHTAVRKRLRKLKDGNQEANPAKAEQKGQDKTVDPNDYPELLRAYRELDWKISDIIRALKKYMGRVDERRIVIETLNGWNVSKGHLSIRHAQSTK